MTNKSSTPTTCVRTMRLETQSFNHEIITESLEFIWQQPTTWLRCGQRWLTLKAEDNAGLAALLAYQGSRGQMENTAFQEFRALMEDLEKLAHWHTHHVKSSSCAPVSNVHLDEVAPRAVEGAREIPDLRGSPATTA